MLSDHYRTTQNAREIYKIIRLSGRHVDNILWQTSNGIRVICEITKMELQEKLNTILVEVSGDVQLVDIMGHAYVKLHHRDSIFKVEIAYKLHNRIVLFIPMELKTLELRMFPRIKFRPKDRKEVTLSLEIDVLSNAYQNLRFFVIDISTKGMSVIVSDSNIHYFKDKKIVYFLKQLGVIDIEKSFRMDVVYNQKFSYRFQGKVVTTNRVGLKFKRDLPKRYLSEFTNKLFNY